MHPYIVGGKLLGDAKAASRGVDAMTSPADAAAGTVTAPMAVSVAITTRYRPTRADHRPLWPDPQLGGHCRALAQPADPTPGLFLAVWFVPFSAPPIGLGKREKEVVAHQRS